MNLQPPCKKLGVATCVCNPSIRGGDRGILRSLWPNNLAEKASFWVSERLETVSWNTTEEESLRPCSGFLVHSFLHSPHTRPAYSHANTMNTYHKHNAYLQNSKIKYKKKTNSLAFRMGKVLFFVSLSALCHRVLLLSRFRMFSREGINWTCSWTWPCRPVISAAQEVGAGEKFRARLDI